MQNFYVLLNFITCIKNGLSDAMESVIPSCNKHAKIKVISSVNCLLKITNSLLWKARCTL